MMPWRSWSMVMQNRADHVVPACFIDQVRISLLSVVRSLKALEQAR